jgi:hypothetical protein
LVKLNKKDKKELRKREIYNMWLEIKSLILNEFQYSLNKNTAL